jgi:tripartite-type tricarboxylate transporter receptor subunit TctC
MNLINKSIISALICFCYSAAGFAQGIFPNKPINLVIPFAAGGPTDVLARVIGQQLSSELGQAVILVNKPGAGGNIASEYVAKAKPDGYTLILGTVGTHAINSSLYTKLPFDVIKDFTPISLTASATVVMVANPSLPAKSIKELLALDKKMNSKLSFASPGSGTPQHLSGELFKNMSGLTMDHIPYKGAAPALTDLLGGHVLIAFVSLPAALPYIKDGKLRALGIVDSKRSPLVPDVPTISESGLKGYEVLNWYGVFGPAGTPKDIVDLLNKNIRKVLNKNEVKSGLVNQGFETLDSSQADFVEFTKSELVKWRKIVLTSGAKAD